MTSIETSQASQNSSAGSVTAYVALGANLGDRERNLRSAIDQIAKLPGVKIGRCSSFIENPAIGGPPGSPAFLNGVVEMQTTLPPRELLDHLLEIERSLGRERHEKWGPRTIDLDLILYCDRIIHEKDLTVPHPLMHKRKFVLEPLAQLAPNLVHPILKRSVDQLLQTI